MAKSHVNREPTYEPAEVEVATPVGPVDPGLADEPRIASDDPAPEPSRRRARGPRRPVVRAQAGHAAGTGEASGA